jgi:uncharacterized membrane protein YadS
MEEGLDRLALHVKYIRSTFIVPIAFIILFFSHLKRKNMAPEIRFSVVKYGFVVGCLFFGAALISTFTPVGGYQDIIRPWYKIIFGAALGAIGLTCDIRKVLKKETVLNIISALIGWIIIIILFIAMMKIFPASININVI